MPPPFRSSTVRQALSSGAVRRSAIEARTVGQGAGLLDFIGRAFPFLEEGEPELIRDLTGEAMDAASFFRDETFDDDTILQGVPEIPEDFDEDEGFSRFRWGVEVEWGISDTGFSDTWFVELSDSVPLTQQELVAAVEMELERRRGSPDSPSVAAIPSGAIDIESIEVLYAERDF